MLAPCCSICQAQEAFPERASSGPDPEGAEQPTVEMAPLSHVQSGSFTAAEAKTIAVAVSAGGAGPARAAAKYRQGSKYRRGTVAAMYRNKKKMARGNERGPVEGAGAAVEAVRMAPNPRSQRRRRWQFCAVNDLSHCSLSTCRATHPGLAVTESPVDLKEWANLVTPQPLVPQWQSLYAFDPTAKVGLGDNYGDLPQPRDSTPSSRTVPHHTTPTTRNGDLICLRACLCECDCGADVIEIHKASLNLLVGRHCSRCRDAHQALVGLAFAHGACPARNRCFGSSSSISGTTITTATWI